MAVNLSPWPADDSDAVEVLKTTLSGAGNLPSTRLTQLGESASELVERFAPDAPQATKNEATIRVAAFLLYREPKPLQSVTIGTAIKLDFRERFFSPNALHNSGARSLLLPWRRRRALPAEDVSNS